MVRVIVVILIVCAVGYGLYLGGFLAVQSKRAVLFVGSLKGNSARFSSCTGFTRRVIRFRDSRPYSVTFSPELTGGSVSLEILDSAKQRVLCLDGSIPGGSVPAEKGKRYYLVIRFQSATGSYSFCWN